MTMHGPNTYCDCKEDRLAISYATEVPSAVEVVTMRLLEVPYMFGGVINHILLPGGVSRWPEHVPASERDVCAYCLAEFRKRHPNISASQANN